ncbi:MAG TPA: cytidine deaminase [Ignavibacteria bacterium]|jgi:cytidine deaminase
MKKIDLIKVAFDSLQHSYSPYSKFRVGAALLCKNGKVFTGTNIENSSYSLTICAERTAIFKAVSEGEREFETIVIATESKELTPPCGACRQVIYEFNPKMKIILTNGKRSKSFSINELLSHPFIFKKRNKYGK